MFATRCVGQPDLSGKRVGLEIRSGNDLRDPFTVGRQNGCGIAAARGECRRLSGFVGELDVPLHRNGLSECGSCNANAKNQEK